MRDIDDPLAQMLQNYPVIWNRSLPIFRNVRRKENAFRKMASDLNVTVGEVLARYKALREKYRKEKIKIDLATQTGGGQLTYQPWHLYDTLRFLDAFQKPRKFKLNTSIGEDTHNDDSFEPTEYIDETYSTTYAVSQESPSHCSRMDSECPDLKTCILPVQSAQLPLFSPTPSAASSSSSGVFSNKKDTKRNAIEGMVEKLVHAAEIGQQTIQPPAVPLSQFEHFGMYVGQSLKNMSPNQSNSATFEISQILFKYNSSQDVKLTENMYNT